MDEKVNKKPKGTVGGGRKLGQKNLLSGEIKKDIRAFFQSLSIENMRWRTNVRRQLEVCSSASEYRFWTRTATAVSLTMWSALLLRPDQVVE